MSFLEIFEKMVELLLILIVGYIACKCHIFERDARVKVTSLILNVGMPATILGAVMTQEDFPSGSAVLQLLVVVAFSYALLFVISMVFSWLLHVPDEQLGIARFILFFGNIGFIGYPVTQAVFGQEGIFYATVFNMPFNMFAYSLGVAMVRRGSESGERKKGQPRSGSDRIRQVRELLLTPCMISAVLALVMTLCRWHGPRMIGETCEMLGAITTPVAMMIIGSSLAEMNVREMFGGVRMYLLAAVRLLVAPLLTWLAFRGFVTDPLLLGVATVMAGMPVATTGTMLCVQYGADERMMAQGTFLTTLLSMVTIPVIATLIR